MMYMYIMLPRLLDLKGEEEAHKSSNQAVSVHVVCSLHVLQVTKSYYKIVRVSRDGARVVGIITDKISMYPYIFSSNRVSLCISYSDKCHRPAHLF